MADFMKMAAGPAYRPTAPPVEPLWQRLAAGAGAFALGFLALVALAGLLGFFAYAAKIGWDAA